MVEKNSVEPDVKKQEASGCRKPTGCSMGCLTLIVLSILFVSWFVFQINDQDKKGKLWCESIIEEYEKDKEKFIEKHSDDMQSGQLYIGPSEEDKVVRGFFRLDNNGEFECSYAHGGFAGPHSNTYYSNTREWVYTD